MVLRWAQFVYRLEGGRGRVVWAGVTPESTHCDAVEVTNNNGQLETTKQLYVDN